jgi:hypothetical protein
VIGVDRVGGLVGSNGYSSAAIIENSFSTGNVIGVNRVGGLVGSHGSDNYNYSLCNESKAPTEGGEFVLVHGNSDLGTDDFYVMKYEAKFFNSSGKNGGGPYYTLSLTTSTGDFYLISKPETNPVGYASYNPDQCYTLMGSNFSSVSNAQWTTIARNLEQVSSNWFGGVVGTNFMYLGHSDGGSDGGINNYRVREATSDDSDGYYKTGENTTSCDGSFYEFSAGDDTTTGLACAGQRRTLYLSTDEVIWDFAGNVAELLVETCNGHPIWDTVSGVREWTFTDLLDDEKGLAGPLGSYNSSHGIGKFEGCSANSFLRGGSSVTGINSGVYHLDLTTPGNGWASMGLRCVYNP